VETYLNIPIPILKADFLRYLILYNDGGIWSDLDVSCEEIPINDWIPAKYKESTNLVVGLEFDWGWENDNFLHSQFASWTVMAKPRSPHVLVIINDILEDFRQKCKDHNVKLPDLKLDMVGHVVDITGPKRMTRGIVKSLELMIQETIDDRYVQSSVSGPHSDSYSTLTLLKRNISGLLSPKLIGDVLILPGNSFGALQSGFPKNQGPALVTHHYAGTWKNEKGGETEDTA
jgi:mannosyltransferase OCH1-like enzyme